MDKITLHELQPNEEKTVTINSRHRYSAERVKLAQNGLYQVTCNEKQSWWDFLIPTTPKGYKHGPANLLGTRVKHAPIFSLCAALLPPNGKEADDTVFQIKTENGPHELGPCEEGILCFFANDTKGWEWNNFGSINVVVKRVL